jgi:hypothetical protein
MIANSGHYSPVNRFFFIVTIEPIFTTTKGIIPDDPEATVNGCVPPTM